MRKLAVVVALLSLCSLAWAARLPQSGKVRLSHQGALAQEAKPAPPQDTKPAPPAEPAQPAAITWRSYEDALALAKEGNKATLVEFRAQWCAWCKKMEKEVYTQGDVIALSDRVVFARADEAQRKDLMKKYGVRGLPTAVILDRNGREIKRIVGYKAAPQFVAEVRQALQK